MSDILHRHACSPFGATTAGSFTLVTASGPSGVAKTAFGVAMIRAEESRRADRLFDDPYADAFLRAVPGLFAAETRAAERPGSDIADWGSAFWAHAVVRTRFFDDWLLGTSVHGINQVVLLAAGLDTRAYRLAWPPGCTLYELDLPETLAFKDAVLNAEAAVPRCDRRPVGVDLREEWAQPLIAAGFDATDPTAWLIEGLFIYLSAEEAARLLTTIGELSAPGGEVAFEYENLRTDPLRAHAATSPAMASYTALWKGGLPDPYAWLRMEGWQPERHDRATVAAEYGRPMIAGSEGGFLTARVRGN
jgi:methyltransferase (TIGR00027 family)